MGLGEQKEPLSRRDWNIICAATGDPHGKLYPEKKVIISEGSRNDHLFYLDTGRVAVFRKDSQGSDTFSFLQSFTFVSLSLSLSLYIYISIAYQSSHSFRKEREIGFITKPGSVLGEVSFFSGLEASSTLISMEPSQIFL